MLEKKVIDTLKLFENDNETGYSIGIFKQPNSSKINLSVTVSINVEEDTQKYITRIRDYHEKLISEDYDGIRLFSDETGATIMASK